MTIPFKKLVDDRIKAINDKFSKMSPAEQKAFLAKFSVKHPTQNLK
jgi:hypothetical protein